MPDGSKSRRKSKGSKGGAITEAVVTEGGNAFRDCYGSNGGAI